MREGSVTASAILVSSTDRTGVYGKDRYPGTEGALHQDDIDPATKFETDCRENADPGKAQRCMQANRWPCIAAADDRNHLPVAEFGAAVEHGREEGPAYAAPDFRLIDVDRILQGEPIGRAGPVRPGIAVAQHPARVFGDQVGQAAAENRTSTGCELLRVRRNLLEGGEPVEDMMPIDRGDPVDIALMRGTDIDAIGAHLASGKGPVSDDANRFAVEKG